MHKNTTSFLVVVALLLVGLIGAGVWVLLDKKQTVSAPLSEQRQPNTYTAEEVAMHNSKSDCWTIISDNVYELTEYVNRHPGGDEILRGCGTDATILFTKRQTKEGQPVGSGSPHSQAAQEQIAPLKIGTLAEDK